MSEEEKLENWINGMYDMKFLIEQKEELKKCMPELKKGKGKKYDESMVQLFEHIYEFINKTIEAFNGYDIGHLEADHYRRNLDVLNKTMKNLYGMETVLEAKKIIENSELK